MADLQKGITFVDGVSIANASNLNNLMDQGTILPAFITAKSDLPSPSTGVEFIVSDGGVFKKVTLANLASVITSGAGGVIHGKTAITVLTDDDEFAVWEDTAAADKKITRASIRNAAQFSPPGSIIQMAYGEYTSSSSINAEIPFDGTVPTNTEGQQILSVAITPRFATSRILARFQGIGGIDDVDGYVIAAMYRNGTCFAAGAVYVVGDEYSEQICLEKRVSPGTTDAQTFTVRVGHGNNGPVRFNGIGSGSFFGGTPCASLVLLEELV